jgi:hypothetical protein
LHLILHSHLCLGLLSDHFLSGFFPRTLYSFLFSSTPTTFPPPFNYSWFITNVILGQGYKLRNSALLNSFPSSCHLLPLV